MKIKNIWKFIRSILIVLGILLLLSLIVSKTILSYGNIEYKIIYVENGDTLWSIASKLQYDKYYNGKDIRYIIEDIKQINNLENSNLYINQEIEIPFI